MATFSQGEAEGAKPFEAVIRNEEKVMNLETLHAELAITPEVSLRRMTPKLTRPDSLDLESLQVRSMDHAPPKASLAFVMKLAFQSIGVVYGDLGTSPLYVYSSTFTHGIKKNHDILGVLSLIIYTLITIPLIKYVFIVLRANDNGEGGTFAMYSLICRHAKITLDHNRHPTDRNISSYVLLKPSSRMTRAMRVKEELENSRVWQNILLVVVLLGPCLVIGDGSLTPAISVLSAIQGIGVQVQDLSVIITIVVLIGLFSLQRFGTHKVAFLFGPVMLCWFFSIGAIGLINIVRWDPSVFRAFNPYYAVSYFIRNKQQAWASLGGVVLCITGSEAMFADLGHFTVKSMQIAFSFFVFPALLCAYIGQAAFLMKNQSMDDVTYTFYRSIPKPVYWPMFAVATCAAIIASQAMISATYSMIRNAMALGCFPRVTIIHTSMKVHGQIYIPEINWMLMVLSIVIVGGFRSTSEIGHAYGIAVVGVFFISTCLLTLIMIMIWQTNIFLCLLFFVVFVIIEGTYFSAVLSKVTQGGWVPLVIAACFLTVMYSWHFGTRMKRLYEISQKLSGDWVLSVDHSLEISRVPGVGLVYTELPQRVPAIFDHIIRILPAIHSTLVFVCIRHIAVSAVPDDERILFRRLGPRNYRMFRCAVRYGYTDLHSESDGESFEAMLLASLERFIRTEAVEQAPDFIVGDSPGVTSPGQYSVGCDCESTSVLFDRTDQSDINFQMSQEWKRPYSAEDLVTGHDNSTAEELALLQKGREAGVAYLLGDIDLHAKSDSGWYKRVIVNHIYSFLRRNCRRNELYLSIPKARLLKVCMEYYI
nr:putative potassium transporter 12 [Physcomitrium patens]|eukprot:XP_024370161.1 putative potassium transporter 12 [Physcomitrella patens]